MPMKRKNASDESPKTMQIGALAHVAVVVGPLRLHRAGVQRQRRLNRLIRVPSGKGDAFERGDDAARRLAHRCRFKSERRARFGRGRDRRAHALDDFARARDQRAVARRHAAVEPDIVLEADPDIAAKQRRLGDERHLHPPDGEARPIGARRQMVSHGQHRFGRRLRAPGDAEAELEERRRVDQPLGDQLLGEPDVTEFEALDLRLHAGRLDAPCHLAQHVGGRKKRPVAEIERTAVECADFRQKLLDMR